MNETKSGPNSHTMQPDLTGHNYDGIEEYDNPTPGWWTWIFVLSIGFSGIYLFIALLVGRQFTPEAFYEQDFTNALKQQYGQLGNVQPDEPTLLKLSHDQKWLRVGQSIFQSNCVSCHGADGSGMSAPNLTDDYYLHVTKLTDIPDVIIHGRKNGAMPAWGQRLLPVEQTLVSSYIVSLRGKNLPSAGGRPTEGTIAPKFPEAAK